MLKIYESTQELEKAGHSLGSLISNYDQIISRGLRSEKWLIFDEVEQKAIELIDNAVLTSIPNVFRRIRQDKRAVTLLTVDRFSDDCKAVLVLLNNERPGAVYDFTHAGTKAMQFLNEVAEKLPDTYYILR